jgi:hypothetical protein
MQELEVGAPQHHLMQNPEVKYGIESPIYIQVPLRVIFVEYKITT